MVDFQQLKDANGITSSTICINGKCITTICPENEPCRTIGDNSTSSAMIILPEIGSNASNGTLILTTDVNGDGIQASASDGSEGPFNEKIVKGSIRLNS